MASTELQSIESTTIALQERSSGTLGSIGLAFAVIGFSEALVFLGFAWYAIWVYVVAVIGFTTGSVMVEDAADIFRAAMFIPVFRLVNLGMPLFFDVTLLWLPLIYGAILPGVYLAVKTAPKTRVSGNSSPFRIFVLLPVGINLAILLAQVEFIIIRPDSLLPTGSLIDWIFLVVVMIGFVGFVEELLFRALLQRTFQRYIGRGGGLLLASIVFGMMHSAYGQGGELVFATVAGLVFGLFYDWTESLWLISLIHGILNIFLFGVFPVYGSLSPGILP